MPEAAADELELEEVVVVVAAAVTDLSECASICLALCNTGRDGTASV